jgi:hypothetical protein
MDSQDIHNLMRVLLDNKQAFDAKAMYHFNAAMVYSQASNSMKQSIKILKKESKLWRKKNQKNHI